MTRRTIANLLIVLSFPFSLHAGTYYVDASGSDSYPGSKTQPWKSIGKAASVLQAGDTVLIRGGIYSEIVTPERSGSADKPIVYSAFPGEMVILDGANITIPEWGGLWDITDREHLIVSNLAIVNAGPHGNVAGIQIHNSRNITVARCSTHNTASSGILIWASSHVVIEQCEIVAACSADSASINECLTVGESSNVEIRDNHVHHGSLVRGEGIDVKDGSHDVKVYRNLVHDVASVGLYVDAWDKHTYNIDIFANVAHDVRGTGIYIGSEQGGLLQNVRIFNNIAYHNQYTGIEIHRCCIALHPLDKIEIVNNTVVNNGWNNWGGGVAHENSQAQRVHIRNNIVSGNLSFQIAIDVHPDSVMIDYNLIDGFRGEQGELRGAHFVEGDPLFLNAIGADFQIKTGSPAIDAGTGDLAPASDFDGRPRPFGSGVDIGAFEYTGTTALEAIRPFDSVSLSIYPNPFKRSCFLQFREGSLLQVYNLLGEKIWQARAPAFWIPSNNVRPGIYFLYVSGPGYYDSALLNYQR